VDYRHVIASLERKPQAFRYSQLRDDLLPSDEYRAVWNWIDLEMEPRKACKTMVGILALADRADCERQLGEYLQKMMVCQTVPSLLELQHKFDKQGGNIPDITVQQPPAASYDDLLLKANVQGVH
jgi:hypothetical protein